MHGKLLNFILFQIAWFCAVLGAARGYPLLGPVVAVAIALRHLAVAQRPGAELKLLCLVVLLGGAADQLIVSAGLIQYRGAPPGVIPLWIAGLWLVFATTLNLSLRWLRERRIAAALLGLVGGPLAYWSGARLGATEDLHPQLALLAAGAAWMVVTPLVMALAARYDGFPEGR